MNSERVSEVSDYRLATDTVPSRNACLACYAAKCANQCLHANLAAVSSHKKMLSTPSTSMNRFAVGSKGLEETRAKR